MRTLLNFLENAVRSLRKIHPFSKDILRGTVQFSLLLSLFGLVMDRLAFETPDILRTLQYARAAMENAPAMLVAGIVCALAADLFLRGKPSGEPNEKPGRKTQEKKSASHKQNKKKGK